MPNLIKLDTREYPVSVQEFKGRFQNTSFSAQIPFSDFGYAVVFDVPQPAHTRIQRAKELPPEISVLGTYQQVWQVVNLQDEMSAEDYQVLLDRFAAEDAAAVKEAARQQAADAARAELLSDTMSKMSYAEIRAHIAGLGLPAPVTGTLTKMAVVLKALVDKGG